MRGRGRGRVGIHVFATRTLTPYPIPLLNHPTTAHTACKSIRTWLMISPRRSMRGSLGETGWPVPSFKRRMARFFLLWPPPFFFCCCVVSVSHFEERQG